MRAVLLVAKGEGRRRIASLIGLALIVGLVGAAVLGAVGGARRSASAIDRFREASDSRDGRAFALTFGDPLGDELVAEMADLDGVAEVGGASIHPTDALFDIDVSLVLPFDDVAYQRIDRPLVLDGRLPDPTADDEVVISELAVDRLGLHTGDRFQASTFSLDDCAALTNDDFQGFNGPQVDLEIVGEVRVIEELQGSDLESGPVLIASPAVRPTLGDEACAAGFLAPFRFGRGEPPSAEAMVAAVRRAAPDASDAQAGTIEVEFLDSVRSAANVAIVALIAFAIVAGAAGLLAVIQAVVRQVESSGALDRTLGAVGLTRSERALALALPITAAGAVGAVLAVVGAVAVSPVFPLGVARRAEPDPGPALDAWASSGGAVFLAILVAGAAFLSARRLAGRSPVAVRGSGMAGFAARTGAAPPLTMGLRLAGDRGPGRTAVRTAMAGAALAVAGVCAVAVLAASLSTVLDRPERFGWAWSSKPDLDSEDPEATLEGLTGEDDLTAVGVLQQASLELEGQGASGFAFEVMKGSITPPIIDGRLPVSTTEIALGSEMLVDVDLGDTVTTGAPDGARVELSVVGRVVTPQIDSSGTTGVLVTPEGMTALAGGEPERALLLTYRPGVDVAALEARLEEVHGVSFPVYSRPNPPGRLVHLDEVRGLLVALAVFFVLLGLAGLAHAMAVSTRRHRGLFATLRSLGFVRGQVARSVLTCAVAIVVIGLVIGVPLGVAAGRLAWQAEVGDLGILDAPSVPVAALMAIVGLALIGGAAVAALPAWRSSRRHPAAVLRAE